MLNVVAAPARAVRELAAIVRKAGLVPRKVTVAELIPAVVSVAPDPMRVATLLGWLAQLQPSGVRSKSSKLRGYCLAAPGVASK